MAPMQATLTDGVTGETLASWTFQGEPQQMAVANSRQDGGTPAGGRTVCRGCGQCLDMVTTASIGGMNAWCTHEPCVPCCKVTTPTLPMPRHTAGGKLHTHHQQSPALYHEGGWGWAWRSSARRSLLEDVSRISRGMAWGRGTGRGGGGFLEQPNRPNHGCNPCYCLVHRLAGRLWSCHSRHTMVPSSAMSPLAAGSWCWVSGAGS